MQRAQPHLIGLSNTYIIITNTVHLCPEATMKKLKKNLMRVPAHRACQKILKERLKLIFPRPFGKPMITTNKPNKPKTYMGTIHKLVTHRLNIV